MTKKSRTQKSKKSEMLEVRMSYEQKQALLAYCRDTGNSASSLVRNLISDRVEPSSWRTVFNRERTQDMLNFLKTKPRAAMAGAASSAALMAFAIAAPSGAQDARAAYDALDTNGDEIVTLAEFVDVVRSEGLIWNPRVDENSARRSVGLSELEGHTRSEFHRYDRNRDGRMTYNEFSGRYVALLHSSFVALDRNSDRRISANELAVSLGGIGYDTASAERNARPRDVMAREMIADFDTNDDGQLDFEEFSAPG